MTAVWFAIKRSLNCNSFSDGQNPKTNSSNSSTRTTRNRLRLCGCSRSIANFKGLIHGSNRHMKKPRNCISSPRSLASSEFVNPISHEVVLNESKCELKITKFSDKGGSWSPFVGTLRPGTPGPRVRLMPRKPGTPFRKVLGKSPIFNNNGNLGACSYPRGSHATEFHIYSTLICQKCGDNFKNSDAVEAHHLSKHAVTELFEGESSRKIVVMICRTSLLTAENNHGHLDRVLKVHNMQKTLGAFEDYREMVKIKANKLSKKHPRCIADGNELLRFYGTTVACTLGLNGSSGLCTMGKCGVCQILRHGFSIKMENNAGGGGGDIGVLTSSTCERAIKSVEFNETNQSVRKALIVCRVIAGRIHRPSESFQKISGQSAFDSLVIKVDRHFNIEELLLLSPQALLPCFVVICRRP